MYGTAGNQRPKWARAEGGDDICDSTTGNTQVVPQIRSNWGVTNLRCRSIREHATWLLPSYSPSTGGEKGAHSSPAGTPPPEERDTVAPVGTTSRKIGG